MASYCDGLIFLRFTQNNFFDTMTCKEYELPSDWMIIRGYDRYITYHLKATALLLKVLERQRDNGRTAKSIYNSNSIDYIGSSPNQSSVVCVSTSITVCALLVDLFLPSFLYIFDIIWFILYCCFFVPVLLCLMIFSSAVI